MIAIGEGFLLIGASACGCLLALSAVQIRPRAIGAALACAAVIHLVFIDLNRYSYSFHFITAGVVGGGIAGAALAAWKPNVRTANMIFPIGIMAGLGEIIAIGRYWGISTYIQNITGFGKVFLELAISFAVLTLIGIFWCRWQHTKWPLAVTILLFLASSIDSSIDIAISIAFLLSFFGSFDDEKQPRKLSNFLLLSSIVLLYYLLCQFTFRPSALTSDRIVAVFLLPAFWYLGVRASGLANSWAARSPLGNNTSQRLLITVIWAIVAVVAASVLPLFILIRDIQTQ